MEMSSRDAHRVLTGIGWLSTLPTGVRERFLSVSETRALPAGTVIYALDDPPGGLYGVADGFVDVLIAPGPFAPRLVHVGRAGWWFGEAAAATGTPRRAEVKTRTQVCVVHISAGSVARLAGEEPRLWSHLAALTVYHVDAALALAAALGSDDLELRILATLEQLVAPWAAANESVTLPIGQAELAEIAGMSRTTVVRVLSSLADAGCVERRYRSITVSVSRLREELQRRGGL
jgi:CRP/FNR family transcriptional regulator, cyclic AMP receptor protein